MPTCVAARVGSDGREDLEVRALIRAAEAGLETVRTPVLHRRVVVGQATGRWHWFVVAALLLAVPAIILPIQMSRASSDPTPVDGIWDAGAFVESNSGRPGGRFLVATVHSGKVDTKLNTHRAMVQSQRNAIAAAVACTGERTLGDLRLHSRGVTGPSAGLIFGLTVVDHLSARDITGGKHVSGSGKLGATGRVGRVGEVAQKAAAAQRATADVFFVPFEQRAEAKRAAPKLNVVGVRNLGDAVRVLTGSGCRAKRA